MKPVVLIVEDNEATVFGYTQFLSGSGYNVVSAATLKTADSLLFNRPDAILLDMKLPDGSGIDWIIKARKKNPDVLIIMITAHGDITSAVEAMQKGADHFFSKPVSLEELDGFLKKRFELDKLRRKDEANRRTIPRPDPYFGNSPSMQNIFKLVSPALSSDTVILLQGKTGTGKGILARWIHEQGPRSSEPFVEVNCASLRGDLLNSELFGHVKGSFTSAVGDRQGLIEVANHGTLFLDEIGDMDMGTQAQLLKAIEEKTYRRIGDSKERQSDFRLICATNHDLPGQVGKGVFREDLYYRICVFPIVMPALRDRMEDFGDLARHLLLSMRVKPAGISDEAIVFLKKYDWPGNVRELKNMLERALILSQDEVIQPYHFPGLSINNRSAADGALPEDLELLEQRHINAVLTKYNGDTIKASQALGISRASLYRKMNKAKLPEQK
jgi:DNA-binding NtrC family response regulator